MPSIDEATAVELARAKICEMENSSGIEFQINDENTQKLEAGWVFFYDSAEFLKTGNTISRLAGNSPLFVSKEGNLTFLPAAIPWRQALNNLNVATG